MSEPDGPLNREVLPSSDSADNTNYLLGWLCWIPPIAVITAIVFLVRRSKRRAFQAILVPVVYVPAIVIGLCSRICGQEVRGGEFPDWR
jgi:hypothetical protein